MLSPRLVAPLEINFQTVTPPFSNFTYIDAQYKGLRPLRRIFSLGRSFNYKTVITESIPASGFVADENNEISLLHKDFIPGEVVRLTFWDERILNLHDLSQAFSRNLLGYAIVKHDAVPSLGDDNYHIFESVFRVQDRGNTCVKSAHSFDVRCGDKRFKVNGVLYCQQNGINKRCAQVAVRTLCSCALPGRDISYGKINEIAKKISPGFNPKKGLEAPEIKGVLKELGLNFIDIDYSLEESYREEYPYFKLVYAAIESGCPALVGFSLEGPSAKDRAHIIPFFGHTFNRDTWVPNAEKTYFHVGANTKYLPSESWLDCFIGHDDNFGSNYSFPRQYLGPQLVDYVVSILPKRYAFDGLIAEATAAHIFYESLPHIKKRQNYWVGQLKEHAKKDQQSIVLRSIALNSTEYIDHLASLEDWEGNKEALDIIPIFEQKLPTYLWVVELSLPELFPVNCRKLGEMVFDAESPEEHAFIFARIPGQYLIGEREKMKPIDSQLKSHTSLVKAFI